MNVGNLKESYLYRRLPQAVISGDERGLINAVLGGVQDRVEDLRSYTRKIGDFWSPDALLLQPLADNVVLVDVQGAFGKNYTSSLDFDSSTPPPGNPRLLEWSAAQLGLPVSSVSNARYGRDPLRLVDANLLSYLAATLGTLLHQSQALSDAQQRAANAQLVSTWFPRLKFKGTAQSFDVLGRILGFDDVRYTPLWQRLAPHQPSDVGNPANDVDFLPEPEYWPAQGVSPVYNPFNYRDGVFYNWSTTADYTVGSNNYYPFVINGSNPYLRVSVLGPVVNGTITHPATGSVALAGGSPTYRAWAEPANSGVRFEAIAEGESFNDLLINFVTNGSLCTISVDDRLSAVKYRSSFFDVALTASMDRMEEIYGSRASTTNTFLEQDPTGAGGVAVSPYTPWIAGSMAHTDVVTDWITSVTNYTTMASPRHQADPTVVRQLNYDQAVIAGVQVIQALEEVRAATRQARNSQVGFSVNDTAGFAVYGTSTLLFEAVNGTTHYTGSVPVLPQSTVTATIKNVPFLLVTWDATIGANYTLRGVWDPFSPHPGYVDFPIGFADRVHMDYLQPGGYQDFSGFSMIRDPIIASVDNLMYSLVYQDINMLSEVDPADPNIYYFKYDGPEPATGTFSLASGAFTFDIPSVAWPPAQMFIVWHPYNSEVIRSEPTHAAKASGTTAYQIRAEDVCDDPLDETTDDVAWRRDIVVGGELADLDVYINSGSATVQPVEDVTVFLDQSAAEMSVYALPSAALPKRCVTEYRPSLNGYKPGYAAVGYKGTFRDLANYTSYDTDLPKPVDPALGTAPGDTRTDYDTLFTGAYSLYHVGLCRGVLVADLPKFNGPHHRTGLVGWLPFNEHPEDDIEVVDHSMIEAPSATYGIAPGDRVFDSRFGWVLRLHGGSVVYNAYRDTETNASVSFWLKVSAMPGVNVKLVDTGSLQVYLNSTSGIEAKVLAADGSFVSIGSEYLISPDAWYFVCATKTAQGATFSYYDLSGYIGAVNLTADLSLVASDQSLVVASKEGTQIADFLIHDLRLWNVAKTYTETLLVFDYAPNKTLCTYPLGIVYTVDHMDRYGLKVLDSGWVVLDSLPPSYRRSSMALIQRYNSLGVYTGPEMFREVGIGGGAQVSSGSLALGRQLLEVQAAGTYAYSTETGYLPGWSDYWATVTGMTSPADMPQTNTFREVIWVDNQDTFTSSTTASIIEGTKVVTLNTPGMDYLLGARVRFSVTAIPSFWMEGFFTSYNGVNQFVYVVDSIGSGSGSIYGAWTVSDRGLYALNLTNSLVTPFLNYTHAGTDVGAFTLPFSMQTLTASGSTPYDGSNTLLPLYLYQTSTIYAQTGNGASWVGISGPNQDLSVTARENAVDPTDMPSIISLTGSGTFLNTPVLGKDGVLEFLNSGGLTQGNYQLTVISGNIGQLDVDFTGFNVEITVASTRLSTKLCSSTLGFNGTGTNVFDLYIPNNVAGTYLVNFEFTNALRDLERGTARQLAIYEYTLSKLTSTPYKVEFGVAPYFCTPIITELDPTDAATPGGWLGVYNSYGTQISEQQESTLYSENDTIDNPNPVASILTGLTGARREDVIYTGTNVVLADATPYVMPTYSAITATPSLPSYQVDDSVTFSVTASGDDSKVYAYVWKWWDGTTTTTTTTTVTRTFNIGSNPEPTGPQGNQVTCTAVAIDGQSFTTDGTFTVNNPPTLIPGASVTVNDSVFSYQTILSVTALDLDNDALSFAWYSGTTFLSAGTSVSAGMLDGTWTGNGVTEIVSRPATTNSFETVIHSARVITCHVTDAAGGETTLDFDMRGGFPLAPTASASAGYSGVIAETLSLPEQRIGQGQTITFTVYAKPSSGTLGFEWYFYGTNNWTMAPEHQTTGITVTPTEDGGSQCVCIRAIDTEKIVQDSPFTNVSSKVATAVCIVTETNVITSQQRATIVEIPVTLRSDDPPSSFTVTRKVNNVAVSGEGPVTPGTPIEFSAAGTDPNGDAVTCMWTFTQPFSPVSVSFFGSKFVYPTTRYTAGQYVQGTLSVTDRLGSTVTSTIPLTLLST